MPRILVILAAAVAIVTPSTARGDIKPNPIFSDNAVLQQGMAVPVWGTATDGDRITVEINGKKATTTAQGGKWMVRIPAMKAGGPYTLTVHDPSATLQFKNVMVGEVWIASGQSNMQWAISQSADPESTAASATDPQIRLLTVPRTGTDSPLSEVPVKWEECSPQTARNFSAVAYHFAKALRATRNVAVGMISTNVGGTPAEAWTRREVLESIPELSYYTTVGNGRKDAGRPMALYNAMIAPIIPYGIKGAIWYQGESNAGKAWEYRTLFPAMIKNWRDDWGQGDFPFLFVQLAPFMDIKPDPMESAWAELRDAQLYTTVALPNTAQAVIVDVGDEKDIHPKQKGPVGERLALAARALAYREKVPYMGPAPSAVKINGNRIEIRFKNTDGGLIAPGGEVKGFTISGEDRKWHNAKAVIEGNKVTVWNEKVPAPKAVRYGWANYPVVNLQNGAGLHASPFRTDDWPYTTVRK